MKSGYKLGGLLLGLVLGGCGGGESSPLPGGSGAEQTFSYGELSGRGARMNAAVTASSRNVSVVGLTGSLSTLDLHAQSSLASTKIAFVSSLDGHQGIYTMNPDGSNPTRLTKSDGVFHSPAWSPDGSKIAFDNGVNISRMNVDGSQQIKLTSNTVNNINPVWSPNGNQIAFASNRDADNHVGNYHIYVMNTDGTLPIQLTHGSFSNISPAWSPDGSRIAFASNRDDNYEIYVMNSDGSNQTRLTNITRSRGNFPGLTYYEYPAWSPDGTKIAFIDVFNQGLNTINTDGTRLVHLAVASTGSAPTWSPDGSRIAFQFKYFNEKMNIYTVNQDGSNRTRLTADTVQNEAPAWSPFATQRKLIGIGGQMGESAVGFLYAQSGNAVPASIVTFNLSSTIVTAVSFQLTAPAELNTEGKAPLYYLETFNNSVPLTDLRYWNLTDSTPVQLGLQGDKAATGALISFSSQEGRVNSVLLFNAATHAAGARPQVTEAGETRVAKGHFVGVWDAHGKNMAPQGALEVTMDARTGEVVGVK